MRKNKNKDKNKNKKYEAAKDSLDNILQILAPYTPKSPKIEQKPEPSWESVGPGKFPIPQHKIGQKI